MTSKTAVQFIVSAIAICVATMTILGNLPSLFWNNWQPATCLSTGCFCEDINNLSSIKQVSNTWSSLGYVVVGCFIASVSGKSATNNKQLTPFYSYLFGVSSIIVGVGSSFYHASITFAGQFFDVFGMYLITTFMLVYALERLVNWRPVITILVFIGINLCLSLLLILVPDTRRYIFAIVLIVALLFEYLLQKIKITHPFLTIGLAIFSLAYLIWILDNTKILCAPESLLQGHAVWHLLGALAVIFLYRYYESELVISNSTLKLNL